MSNNQKPPPGGDRLLSDQGRLLQLPREIRDQIYASGLLPMHRELRRIGPERAAVMEACERNFTARRRGRYTFINLLINPPMPHNPSYLFHVCQQIRDESLDFICRWNEFCFEVTNEDTPLFEAPLRPFLQRILYLQLAVRHDALTRYGDRLYELLISSAPRLKELVVFQGHRCYSRQPDTLWMERNEAVTQFIGRLRSAPSMNGVIFFGESPDHLHPAVSHRGLWGENPYPPVELAQGNRPEKKLWRFFDIALHLTPEPVLDTGTGEYFAIAIY